MRVALGAMAVVFVALAAEQPNSGPIRFEEVSAQAGIQFTHSFGAEKLGSLLESTGAGAVWFDYNNDGLMDLYVVSGKPLGAGMHPYPLRHIPQVPPHNHLFRNLGNGKFTDVTEQAGVGGDLFSMAAIAADFDNDGNVDLLVTGYGRVILYRNKGDGTFEDVTEKAGINVSGWSIGAAWLDYDRDGCVDLFVGRYVKFDPDYHAYYAADNYPGPLDYEPQSNVLLHNNCNGTFTDVSEKSGIGRVQGPRHGRHRGRFRSATATPTSTSPTTRPRISSSTTRRTERSRRLPSPRAWLTDRAARTRRPWGPCFSISTTMAAWICGSRIPSTTA